MARSEVADVRTALKCLMRQTDNSDNSTGDRIENSATEIARSGRGMDAAILHAVAPMQNTRTRRVESSYVQISS